MPMIKNDNPKSSELSEAESFARMIMKTWERVGTPLRPSEGECRLYEQYVERLAVDKSARVLILGATPELRDIVLRHDLKPVSCDYDNRIWNAMTLMLKESGDEDYIQCDWLQLPENKDYDMVLGDASLNMLPEDLVEPFIKKTANLTKRGGFNIQRIGCSYQKLTIDALVEAVEEYRQNGYDMSIFQFTVLLAMSIRSCHYPQYTGLEMYEKEIFNHFNEKEIAETRPFLADKIFFFPEREKLEGLLTKYFEILRVVDNNDPGYWGAMNTYIMRRN